MVKVSDKMGDPNDQISQIKPLRSARISVSRFLSTLNIPSRPLVQPTRPIDELLAIEYLLKLEMQLQNSLHISTTHQKAKVLYRNYS